MRRKLHEVINQIILLQIFLDWNDGWLQVMAQSERLSESKRIVEVVAIYSISVCKFKPWNRIDYFIKVRFKFGISSASSSSLCLSLSISIPAVDFIIAQF